MIATEAANDVAEESVLERLSSSGFWTSGPFVVSLAVLSVVGVTGTLWFGFAPNRVKKRLRHGYENVVLVPDELAQTGIKLLAADDQPSERVTLTSALIANSGRAAITGAQMKPAEAGFPEGIVLRFGESAPSIVAGWNASSEAAHAIPKAVKIDLDGEQAIQMTFSVLEPGEAIRIDVIHDSTTEAELSVHGKVVDGLLVGDGTSGRLTSVAMAVSDDLVRSLPFGSLALAVSRSVSLLAQPSDRSR